MSVLEVLCRGLDADGQGVASGPDGATLRVAGLLPGEAASVRLEAGGGARPEGVAHLEALIAPSPDRVAPPCPNVGRCGGCAIQAMAPAAQAAWKRARIVEALARRGVEAETVDPTMTSPPSSRRRMRLAARRGKSGVTIGLHGFRSDRVTPIDGCLVARPEILAARPALAELARLAAPRDRPIGLDVTVSLDGLDVGIQGAKPADGGTLAAAARLAEAAGWARLTWNGAPAALLRPPRQRFGQALVTPPPGAFLQATLEGEAALVTAAREGVGAARRVADLFAGCGTFALPLAERAEVLAVEGEAAMTEALAAGWRGADGLKRVVATTRDLFRRPLGPDALRGIEAVVLDPPRAGAEAQTRALAEADLERIVMASCEPSTFARDAALLVARGWRLARVTPIDQFLWSGHVEMAAVFTRRTNS